MNSCQLSTLKNKIKSLIEGNTMLLRTEFQCELDKTKLHANAIFKFKSASSGNPGGRESVGRVGRKQCGH